MINKTDPIRRLGYASLNEFYASISDADSRVYQYAICRECGCRANIEQGVVVHKCERL